MSQTLPFGRVFYCIFKDNLRVLYSSMVKNFYEYINELIPEKGSVFFSLDNHSTRNDISLYQIADLLCGKKCRFAVEATAYSWNVLELWRYIFPTMGVMFLKENGEEIWCHISKAAFVSAICIVAIRNGITFDDEVHEKLRQLWERRINNETTVKDMESFRKIEQGCMNFDDILYITKPDAEERRTERRNCWDWETEEEQQRREKEEKEYEEERLRKLYEEKKWFEQYKKKRERREREAQALLNGEVNTDEHN